MPYFHGVVNSLWLRGWRKPTHFIISCFLKKTPKSESKVNSRDPGVMMVCDIFLCHMDVSCTLHLFKLYILNWTYFHGTIPTEFNPLWTGIFYAKVTHVYYVTKNANTSIMKWPIDHKFIALKKAVLKFTLSVGRSPSWSLPQLDELFVQDILFWLIIR